LEIGCGAGEFLQKAAAEGWRATGIELSAPAARRARRNGLEVINAPLETAPAPAVPYDVVVGWMVLEHLHNPVAALQRLHRWTRPGGKLAVSVPDGRAAVFGLFGESEYALQLPVHLYHFTRETLTRLLSKGGWRVEKIRYQRILNNAVAGMGLKLTAANRLPRIARQLLAVPSSPRAPVIHAMLYPAAFLAAAWGRTGRMTAWAVRK
jgi:2-polyprenyl-3-methyl-5-hydroxy-6-metoxy-1,4-benzoquinol methylase